MLKQLCATSIISPITIYRYQDIFIYCLFIYISINILTGLLARTKIDVLKRQQKLFVEIVGYDKIKAAFVRFLSNDRKINVILNGAPATSKTVFLLSMRKNCKNTYYIDCANATKAGMLDQLLGVKSNTEILLLDEIGDLKKEDQRALLNLMETGELISTKVKKQASKTFNGLKVFCTCNEIDNLSSAFRSRCFRLNLKPYNYEEFLLICRKLGEIQFNIKEDLAQYIGERIWNDVPGRDIRDFVKVADHSKDQEEADLLIELLITYGDTNVEGEEQE